MKKLLLYPRAGSEEHVVYTFGDGGTLESFEIHKAMTEAQFDGFKRLLPYDEPQLMAMLQDWQRDGVKYRLVEGAIDLSFERFYNTYAFHGGAKLDRISTEKKWLSMSDSDRTSALRGIKQYAQGCKNRNTAMKRPEGYLLNKNWLDEK